MEKENQRIAVTWRMPREGLLRLLRNLEKSAQGDHVHFLHHAVQHRLGKQLRLDPLRQA